MFLAHPKECSLSLSLSHTLPFLPQVAELEGHRNPGSSGDASLALGELEQLVKAKDEVKRQGVWATLVVKRLCSFKGMGGFGEKRFLCLRVCWR